jgi:tetratricopeptide (TPR) repeat protein
MGQTRQAEEHYTAALALQRSLSQSRAEVITLTNLALLYVEQGRHDEAGEQYHVALLFHRSSGDRRAEGIVLGNLGRLHRLKGEHDAARRLLSEALAIHQDIGFRHPQGEWLSNLALLDMACDNLGAALQHAQDAVVASRAYPGLHAQALCTLARCHLACGALDPSRAALSSAQALKSSDQIMALISAVEAMILQAEGNHGAAHAACERVRASAHHHPHNELGRLASQVTQRLSASS